MKSELHSKDRYEVANNMPSRPVEPKDIKLAIFLVLLVIIGIIAFGVINYLFPIGLTNY
jgi:hypothetical protein